jgi:A/G-specific adenine glycosylase
LAHWYARSKRDLPWRNTRDPYKILVSEIMLQQTRARAVIPYYESFLDRFPSARELAEAPEAEVLRFWSGLGYYQRARNLQRAARRIAQGGFPEEYAAIRELEGVGDYTAAAVASIAFGKPHAAVDGNVMRVIARLTGDASDIGAPAARARFATVAASLLDRRDPGGFNQAMMELGATICLPRSPLCLLCPVAEECRARALGTQAELPVKLKRIEPKWIQATLLVIERAGKILLWRRKADAKRLGGFWELPSLEEAPGAALGEELGEFRHSITNHNYTFSVLKAQVLRPDRRFQWLTPARLKVVPLSTVARKALVVAGKDIKRS